jgi:hypothetical protein
VGAAETAAFGRVGGGGFVVPSYMRGYEGICSDARRKEMVEGGDLLILRACVCVFVGVWRWRDR